MDGRVPLRTDGTEPGISFFDAGFLRVATPSGHLHCVYVSGQVDDDDDLSTYLTLPLLAPRTVRFHLVTLRRL